jgi:peroxiredoxin
MRIIKNKLIYLLCLSFLISGCKNNVQSNAFNKVKKEIKTFNSLTNELDSPSNNDLDSIKIYFGIYETIKKPQLFDYLINESLPFVFLPQQIVKYPEFSSKILDIISSKKYLRLYQMTLGLQAYAKAEEAVFTQNAVNNIKDYINNSNVNTQNRVNCLNTIISLESSLPVSKEALSERYRLMIYNLLSGQFPNSDYGYILDEVIKNSKEILSNLDTTKLKKYEKYRARYRYYLADAYYLKANLALKFKDKEKALKDFQLSSNYSPDASDRNIRTYLSDKIYLHGFDDYSLFYQNELKAAKDPEAALDLLARSTVYNVDNEPELRALFKKLHPSGSFRKYWRKELDKILPAAPNFELKSLSGKIINLSDFRGKWVVLDFWGSWCHFCVQEMPNIEELFDYINNHRKNNACLLTLNYGEKPERTEKFMHAMNYNFPIVFADSKVINDYKITGFPTKFLITPAGKYFEMPFDSDWKRTVREYVFNSK